MYAINFGPVRVDVCAGNWFLVTW